VEPFTHPNIEFDPTEHKYYLDGYAVPGVSEVIDVSGLDEFSRIPEDLLAYKSELGTNIHEMLELYDKGSLDEKSLNATLQPFLVGYKRFLQDYKPTIKAIEQMFIGNNYDYPDEVYIGRVDRIFGIGEDNWIIDIKTGGKYKYQKLQTAGYLNAYRTMTDVNDLTNIRGCLYLNKEGEYDLKFHEDDVDMHRFFSCLGIFYYRYPKYRKTEYNLEVW